MGHESMQATILLLQPSGRRPEASIPQDYVMSTPVLVALITGYRCPILVMRYGWKN